MSRPHLGDPREFRKGYDHIRKSDARLAKLLEKHGVIEFRPEGQMFEALVESILSQQLAAPAANSIIAKVRAIYPGGKLDALAMSRTPSRRLRAAGVSPQKISYLKDLSGKVAKGKIDLEALREMEDEEILTTLDAVRGVGPWTVHMILLFTLGRPDVLPVDDLAIRRGIQRLYSMKEMPKKDDIEKLAERWSPYSSVASLYIWRHNRDA